MSSYFARVELHSAAKDDYEVLHASMQRRSFKRTIKGGDGRTYQLPTGTYVMENTNDLLSDAVNAANDAAKETGKKSWVLAVEWSNASWLNLPIV